MNVNFELYKIFYAVAVHENITKAAEELFISQPAVSKSIKNLEEQLGGQLFFRQFVNIQHDHLRVGCDKF